MELIASRQFRPSAWKRLTKAEQETWRHADRQVRQAMACPQPSYDELARMHWAPHAAVAIRPDISAAMAPRPAHSYSVMQEKTCLEQVLRRLPPRQATLYQVACGVYALLFGQREPLRNFDVTMAYLKWLRIAPPADTSPVFLRWSDLDQGPALFAALNLYLIMLTSHPFSDGNGRTARILFNLLLSWRHDGAQHYVPIADILKRTPGSFEELLARAAVDGDYQPPTEFLRHALAAYAGQVLQPEARATENALTTARRLADQHRRQPFPPPSPNDAPPYPVSMQTLRDEAGRGHAHPALVQALDAIATELRPYGRLSHVLLRLDDLSIAARDQPAAAAYFFHLDRKEEFALHVRAMRTRYKDVISIQFAAFTGDTVIDAKVSIGLAAQYSKGEGDDSACTAILYDFDVGQSGGVT